VDIDFLFYFNVALHVAADVNTFNRDVRFNQRAFSDNQRSLPENLSLKISVDTNRPVKDQFTDKLRSLAQEGLNLFDFFLFLPHVIPLEFPASN
jgi:hypothetical protein